MNSIYERLVELIYEALDEWLPTDNRRWLQETAEYFATNFFEHDVFNAMYPYDSIHEMTGTFVESYDPFGDLSDYDQQKILREGVAYEEREFGQVNVDNLLAFDLASFSFWLIDASLHNAMWKMEEKTEFEISVAIYDTFGFVEEEFEFFGNPFKMDDVIYEIRCFLDDLVENRPIFKPVLESEIRDLIEKGEGFLKTIAVHREITIEWSEA